MTERKMIYLDDAINALERKKDKKAKGDIGGFYNKIIQNDIDALMKLTSAQPEPCEGTISRQSAIQAAECIVDHHAITPYQTMRSAMDHLQRILRGMPSTQPERMRGKWIKMSDADGDYYVCDQCGEELPRYTTESPTWDSPYPPKYSIDKTNFCSNCGADMREELDEAN